MCSANIHTPNVLTNCRMMAEGTSRTPSSTRRNSHPSTGPTIRLPATASRNAGATDPNEKLFAAAAPTASR